MGDAMREENACSLYIHIPFCLQKCRYCDFLSGPQPEGVRDRYVRALIREILCFFDGSGDPPVPGEILPGRPAGGQSRTAGPASGENLPGRPAAGPGLPPPVDTIFLGGGTPSVLTGDQIRRIMEALRTTFRIREDAEISMEVNPGTADMAKLRAFREAGINRLSLGVQSMRDEELLLLGRIHTADQARRAYDLARKAGFDNINLDLMSALPGQTFGTWADTLDQAVRWGPDHISAYSLIMEEGTPFARMYEAGTLPPLPDEETDREMYRYTRTFLEDHGYHRYEISNYARPGRECRHNSGYWTGHPYAGFGIGAASCLAGVRYSNITDLQEYLRILTGPGSDEKSLPDPRGNTEKDAPDAGRTAGKMMTAGGSVPPYAGPAENALDCRRRIRTDIHPLSQEEKMEEFMFLGLRMTAGVQAAEFASRFGRTLDQVYGDTIRRHEAQGLVSRTETGICLTERGIDISNYVLADYLLG